jgi:carbamoyltransferase
MIAEFNIPDVPAHSILGLSYSGMHDSSIAIITPTGEIIFAVSLERISRVKQDGRYPALLLKQVPWESIDKIAVSVEQEYDCAIDRDSLHHPAPLTEYSAFDRAHKDVFYQYLKSLNKEIFFVPHHLSHAASAFWLSDFDNALCFVYDGGMANEEWFGGLYQASKAGNIQPIDHFGAQRYANVTHVYTAVTAVLGFTPLKHEGKITGLAAYGEKNDHCDNVLNRWLLEPRTLDDLFHWKHMYSDTEVPKLTASLQKIAKLKQELGDVCKEDIAFSVQKLAENHVLEILINWQKAGHDFNNICLSGGLFANVKINQRISELGFDNLFVSPPMADDGTALGAALHIASQGEKFKPQRAEHIFLGPVSSQAEIDELILSNDIKTLVLDKEQSAADTVAKLLDDGKIVAVYLGKSEFGPRSLGNRSILANADNPDINRSLNEKLNRTEFMPFAPMCLKSHAHLYFDNVDNVEHAAEFMTVTLDCTPIMKELCPAVVHCDGTARPQLVTATSNPFIFDVLTAYQAFNGKPAIVNTSFNVHEEPIVCSAEDALKGFFESGLDYLYLQGHIISLADNRICENKYLKQKISTLNQNMKNKQGTIALHYDEVTIFNQKIQGYQLIAKEKESLSIAYEKLSLDQKITVDALDKVQANFELLNETLANKEQEIINIYDSTSWKITAPLRAFSQKTR